MQFSVHVFCFAVILYVLVFFRQSCAYLKQINVMQLTCLVRFFELPIRKIPSVRRPAIQTQE